MVMRLTKGRRERLKRLAWEGDLQATLEFLRACERLGTGFADFPALEDAAFHETFAVELEKWHLAMRLKEAIGGVDWDHNGVDRLSIPITFGPDVFIWVRGEMDFGPLIIEGLVQLYRCAIRRPADKDVNKEWGVTYPFRTYVTRNNNISAVALRGVKRMYPRVRQERKRHILVRIIDIIADAILAKMRAKLDGYCGGAAERAFFGRLAAQEKVSGSSDYQLVSYKQALMWLEWLVGEAARAGITQAAWYNPNTKLPFASDGAILNKRPPRFGPEGNVVYTSKYPPEGSKVYRRSL